MYIGKKLPIDRKNVSLETLPITYGDDSIGSLGGYKKSELCDYVLGPRFVNGGTISAPETSHSTADDKQTFHGEMKIEREVPVAYWKAPLDAFPKDHSTTGSYADLIAREAATR